LKFGFSKLQLAAERIIQTSKILRLDSGDNSGLLLLAADDEFDLPFLYFVPFGLAAEGDTGEIGMRDGTAVFRRSREGDAFLLLGGSVEFGRSALTLPAGMLHAKLAIIYSLASKK
jgi:hypothetical protein